MTRIGKNVMYSLIYFTSLMGVSPPSAQADSRHVAQEVMIEHLKNQLQELTTVKMKVTAYAPKHPEKGKMGKVIPGLTCAVSRDRAYMLGRKVNVPGVGLRRVNDLLAKGATNSLDLAVGSKRAARKWGVQRREVTLINKKG